MCRAHLPQGLREAIVAGHAGLALLPGPDDTDPLRLICAAPADRLSALATVGLAVRASGVSDGSLRERLVVLEVRAASDATADARRAEAAETRVGIDLGYPEGRELARRLANHRGLLLCRVATRSGRLLEPRMVTFAAADADALLSALARAGEWHTEPPPPVGLSNEQWRRLADECASPRLAALPGADGLVVAILPEPAFRGVDLGRRRPVVVHPPADRHAPLELRFASPAGGVGRVSLPLHDEGQRRLGARVADQPGLIVICLQAGAPRSIVGCVRLEMSPRTRGIIRAMTSTAQHAANR